MGSNAKTVVSLFSGCGGMDLGSHKDGFDIICANDFDKYAVKTYSANFNNKCILSDITKINIKDITKLERI